jgi:hypothetical protein
MAKQGFLEKCQMGVGVLDSGRLRRGRWYWWAGLLTLNVLRRWLRSERMNNVVEEISNEA